MLRIAHRIGIQLGIGPSILHHLLTTGDIDQPIDDDVNDVDAMRSEFSCKALSKGTTCEFGRSEA